MNLTRRRRTISACYGGSGGIYPRLLTEDGGHILTEGGDYLAMEGVDDPTIVDLPCVAFFHAMSLGKILQPGDAVAGWPNIAPGHTEKASYVVQAIPDPAAYYYPDEYGGYADFHRVTLNTRLDITPNIIYTALNASGDPLGWSAFVVCSLTPSQEDVSALFGYEGMQDAVLLKSLYTPLRENLYVASDSAFTEAWLYGDVHTGGWPARITPATRALVEYRINFKDGQWHQSLFVDGIRQGTRTLTTGGVAYPNTRTISFIGQYYTGKLWQMRVYSEQLSDADQLAVRRELCSFYGLPCYTDL